MSTTPVADLHARFEAALAYRVSQLNTKTAGELLAKSVAEHASSLTSSSQNGYADAHNAVIFAAQRLLKAVQREEVTQLANRHHIPEWDQHANEMRAMLLKLVGGAA